MHALRLRDALRRLALSDFLCFLFSKVLAMRAATCPLEPGISGGEIGATYNPSHNFGKVLVRHGSFRCDQSHLPLGVLLICFFFREKENI